MDNVILLMLNQNNKSINLEKQSSPLIIVGILCNILQPLLYISPLRSFITSNKTGKAKIPILYLVFNLLNSLFWIILSAKKFDLAVLIANSLSGFCFLLYILYTIILYNNQLETLIPYVNFLVISISIISFLSWRFISVEISGVLAIISESISYISTLSYFFDALNSNNKSSIDIFISGSIGISTLSWVIYSIMDKNIVVLLPNLIGLLMSLCNIVLYMRIYLNDENRKLIQCQIKSF